MTGASAKRQAVVQLLRGHFDSMWIAGGARRLRGGAAEAGAKPVAPARPFVGVHVAQATDEIDRAEQRQAEQEERADPAGNRAAEEHDAPAAAAPRERREADLPGQGEILDEAQEPQGDGG